MTSPIHRWSRQLSPRHLLVVKWSRELWYNKLANGEIIYHLWNIGWYIRPEYPGVTIYTFTLLGLSIRFGVYKK